MKSLGVVPSPKDDRDSNYLYQAYGDILPEIKLPEVYIPGIQIKVGNQGAVSSCVAFAGSRLRKRQEYRELGKLLDFSTKFSYLYRPHTWDYKGPGMVPRQYLRELIKVGVPLQEDFPGNVEWGTEQITDEQLPTLLEKARPHRAEVYVTIPTFLGATPESVRQHKSAILTLDGALYAVPIYENFSRMDSAGHIPYPAGKLIGFHMMVTEGWKPHYYLVPNSWDIDWGPGALIPGTSERLPGTSWMHWDYPIQELWSVTDRRSKKRLTIKLWIGSKIAAVNGQLFELDVAPFIQGNRTYVPIRFVAEFLGAIVGWDGEKYEITIEADVPWTDEQLAQLTERVLKSLAAEPLEVRIPERGFMAWLKKIRTRLF